ncbi:hypothetical protein WJX75_001092 [Coccomyxa subellipsoidea]|uniref:Uncharacterized protein n=1 Tax=Coccomyxa subellipsoidea TaxID=248742 RepID=A0ABR2Z1K5_9CHLO
MAEHRLDTRHGFFQSIVRNQQARDNYEQSWQEAYKEAGPFQQRWGVGVKVSESRRMWSQVPDSDEKTWWRRPVDMAQTDMVRILQRTSNPGSGSSLRPMTHEEVEASLYNTHLSAGSQAPHAMGGSSATYEAALQEQQILYSSQQSQPPQQQPMQMRVPSIGYDGVALGVPVYMQQHPAAGPPTPLEPMAMAGRQAPNAAPAGWAYDSAISGWGGCSLPTPQISPSPQHDAKQGITDHPSIEESEAAKEKVRLGFQVYRPPPQLGQPSSLKHATNDKGRASHRTLVPDQAKSEHVKRAQHSNAEAGRDAATSSRASRILGRTPKSTDRSTDRAPVKLPKHESSDPDKLSKKRTVDSAPSRKSRAGYTAKAKAARGTPGTEPMTPSGASGVNPSRRERKGRRVEANGVASSDAPARDAAHLQASASGKKAVGGDTRPSNSAAQPAVPPGSKQRKGARRAQDSSSANGGPPAAKEASSDALSGRPPGLGPAEAGGTAAPKGQAGEKNGGGHNGVSRALGRALAPAYFERPAKQQQPRGSAAI